MPMPSENKAPIQRLKSLHISAALNRSIATSHSIAAQNGYQCNNH